MRRGFTVLEILIVITVFVVMAGIVTVSLSRYTRAQAVTGAATALVSELEDARSRTLASRGGVQYGVHLEDGSITLFRGETYDPNSAQNEVTSLDPRVTLTPSLASGGADIVFERLSGETDDHGTIVVALASDAAFARTIILQQTGLISYND